MLCSGVILISRKLDPSFISVSVPKQTNGKVSQWSQQLTLHYILEICGDIAEQCYDDDSPGRISFGRWSEVLSNNLNIRYFP